MMGNCGSLIVTVLVIYTTLINGGGAERSYDQTYTRITYLKRKGRCVDLQLSLGLVQPHPQLLHSILSALDLPLHISAHNVLQMQPNH